MEQPFLNRSPTSHWAHVTSVRNMRWNTFRALYPAGNRRPSEGILGVSCMNGATTEGRVGLGELTKMLKLPGLAKVGSCSPLALRDRGGNKVFTEPGRFSGGESLNRNCG